MFRLFLAAVLSMLLLAGLVCAGDDDDDKRDDERRLARLEKRANKLPAAASKDDHARFLEKEARRLLERFRKLRPGSWDFDRMLEALDGVLDAREHLVAAAEHSGVVHENRDRKQRDTAKRLERAYFRVQQAQYFAKLSGDKEAAEYVRRSRHLYQQARSAYDEARFRRAQELASAADELVDILENFAQAAVRKPEPPVLK